MSLLRTNILNKKANELLYNVSLINGYADFRSMLLLQLQADNRCRVIRMNIVLSGCVQNFWRPQSHAATRFVASLRGLVKKTFKKFCETNGRLKKKKIAKPSENWLNVAVRGFTCNGVQIITCPNKPAHIFWAHVNILKLNIACSFFNRERQLADMSFFEPHIFSPTWSQWLQIYKKFRFITLSLFYIAIFTFVVKSCTAEYLISFNNHQQCESRDIRYN